jgi:hypothetical protein
MIRSLYLWVGSRVFQRINPGFNAYGVIPTKDAITFLVNERVLNNSPRYKRQLGMLLNSRALEVRHLGLILRFKLSFRSVSLNVVEEVTSSTEHACIERLPMLPWRRGSALMRFMAAQEVALWP